MSFSFFNSFNGNSQRLGQNYSIVSADVNPPGLVSSIGSDMSSVTFSFTAPGTGGTISGYTAYVNGKPFSGTGGPSSYTINGLAQGGQYTINMVANIVSTSSTSTTTTSTFTPTSISGCTAWWDASDPYGTGTPPANGTAISTWTDKSGSGYNGIAQSGLIATYTSASKTLNFNNAYYTTNYPANPTYETCFMVSNYTNTNVEVVLIGSTAGGRIVVYNGNLFSLGTSYVGGGSYSTGLATNGTNNLAVTVINTIATSYSSLNGALTLNGPTAMGAFTAGKTTFLGRDGNPKIFYGNVCEILMYNTALSTTDRQKVEGYLAWKWSMQSKLPSGHPYYSTNGYITSNTVITTNTKNILSNPSQPVVISTLAPLIILSSTWTPSYSNLVAYFKLDENSGSTSATEQIAAYNGTIVGGVTFGSTGKVVNCATFNGSTGYVSVPKTVLNNLTSGTIMTWIYPTSISSNAIFSKQHDGWYSVVLSIENGTIRFINGYGYQLVITSNSTVSVNTWSHVTYTFTTTSASIYINGQLDKTVVPGTNVQLSNTVFGYGTNIINDTNANYSAIGAWPNNGTISSPFAGQIDDFSVWNTALSGNNITTIYNHQTTGSA